MRKRLINTKIDNLVSRLYNLIWGIRFSFSKEKTIWFTMLPLIIIELSISIGVPYILKLIIESLLEKEQNRVALIITCGVSSLFLLSVLSSYYENKKKSYALAVTFVVQGEMYRYKHSCIDYQTTETHTFKKLEQYAGSDASNNGGSLDLMFVDDVQKTIMSVFGLMFCMSLMRMIDYRLMVIVSILSILSFVFHQLENHYYNNNLDKVELPLRAVSYLSGLSLDLSKGKDIRYYGMRQWLLGKLYNYQSEIKNFENSCSIRGFIGNICEAIFSAVQNGVTYLFLFFSLMHKTIGIGDFVFLLGVVGSIQGYINSFFYEITMLNKRAISIGYYRSYFTQHNCVQYHRHTFPMRNSISYRIDFEKVYYTPPNSNTYIINDFSLTIMPGERIALVGETGSGKTTIARLLCRLYTPTAGHIIVDGHDIQDYSIYDYYGKVAPVFQDIQLPNMTIKEFFIAGEMKRHSNDEIRIQKVLLQTGLLSLIDSLPNKLNTYIGKGVYSEGVDFSAGEKQRLLLARALFKDSPIIVFDEPTAALDPLMEEKIYSEFDMITKGKSTIFISHRLASTKFCDRIVYIEHGQIVECGSHHELLLSDGAYSKLYKTQSMYYKA